MLRIKFSTDRKFSASKSASSPSAKTLVARLAERKLMKTDSKKTNELIKLTSKNYPMFADYCNYLDKGLRKDALKCLESFLDNTKDWDYLTKATFCKTIFSISTTNNDIAFVLTTNLTDKLIKPTLLEIITQEPDNYLAFKWYGQYFRDTAFIKKALDLNPSDSSIKLILLNNLENDIWTSTHHLPDGYLGDINQDEQDIELAFSLLDSFNKKTTEEFFNRFTDYKNAIDNYKENDKKPSH